MTFSEIIFLNNDAQGYRQQNVYFEMIDWKIRVQSRRCQSHEIRCVVIVTMLFLRGRTKLGVVLDLLQCVRVCGVKKKIVLRGAGAGAQ